MTGKKTVLLNFYIEPNLCILIKSRALELGLSVSALIRQALVREIGADAPEQGEGDSDTKHAMERATLARRIARGEREHKQLTAQWEVATRVLEQARAGKGAAEGKLAALHASGVNNADFKRQSIPIVRDIDMHGSLAKSQERRMLILGVKLDELNKELTALYTEGLDYEIPAHPRYVMVTDPPIVPVVDPGTTIAPPAWQRAAKGG